MCEFLCIGNIVLISILLGLWWSIYYYVWGKELYVRGYATHLCIVIVGFDFAFFDIAVNGLGLLNWKYENLGLGFYFVTIN
jgi:hypothetical protein